MISSRNRNIKFSIFYIKYKLTNSIKRINAQYATKQSIITFIKKIHSHLNAQQIPNNSNAVSLLFAIAILTAHTLLNTIKPLPLLFRNTMSNKNHKSKVFFFHQIAIKTTTLIIELVTCSIPSGTTDSIFNAKKTSPGMQQQLVEFNPLFYVCGTEDLHLN